MLTIFGGDSLEALEAIGENVILLTLSLHPYWNT